MITFSYRSVRLYGQGLSLVNENLTFTWLPLIHSRYQLKRLSKSNALLVESLLDFKELGQENY